MANSKRSTGIGAGLQFWFIAAEHASRHVFIGIETLDIRRAACIHVDDLLKREHWLSRMPAEHVRQVRDFAVDSRPTVQGAQL